MKMLLAIVLGLTLLCGRVSGRQAVTEPLLELREGMHQSSGTPIRIGSIRVWENRAEQAGRRIKLEVVVLPAIGDDTAADPVFVLAGGPGQNAASLTGMWAEHWMRDRRDIVLVSQRGTGGDNRLWCELPGSDDNLQGYLEPVFLVDHFEACLRRLRDEFDLTQYGTANAVDDVNEVRAALGYDKINLYGGSYGSRAELEYIRRHPETVRTAILNSVAPVSFINPLYHAWGAQHVLDEIMNDCSRDPGCADAYADLRESFGRIMRRLDRRAVITRVPHPRTGEDVKIRLDRESFGEALRIMMYFDRSQVPYLIDRAAKGDFAPFAAQGIRSQRAIRGQLALGMLLCVTCSEDVDRITEELIVIETAGTYLGDARVRRQQAVCAIWPRSELPDDAGEPVTADVPVLLLSGRYDPVTPPRWGRDAAEHLPSGLHVVGPYSHGQGGWCFESIMNEVLERGTVEGVDVGCVDRLKPVPFRLPD